MCSVGGAAVPGQGSQSEQAEKGGSQQSTMGTVLLPDWERSYQFPHAPAGAPPATLHAAEGKNAVAAIPSQLLALHTQPQTLSGALFFKALVWCLVTEKAPNL